MHPCTDLLMCSEFHPCLQLSPGHAPVLVSKDWIMKGTFWTSMELGVSISGLQCCSSAVSKLGLCWSSLY